MIKGSLDVHAGKVYLARISTSLQRPIVAYQIKVNHVPMDREASKYCFSTLVQRNTVMLRKSLTMR